MKSQRVLITGGAGFIGSHLAERLLKEGHHVTILDDLSTGCYANIAHLERQSCLSLVIDSVLNEPLVAELVRDSDRVFHLASPVGIKVIMTQPIKTIKAILGGVDCVMRYCTRYHKRVLITSTSEVYGASGASPYCENDNLLIGILQQSRWSYAYAKALGELLALARWKETKLPVVVVRLFNTTGPRQTGQYGMVVPRFVQAALRNKPLTIYGDGEQTRCFVHVNDVVAVLSRSLENPACFGQIINIGSEQEVTINQLAETIRALSGSRSEIRHITYYEAYGEEFADVRRRVPHLKKAQCLLGYRPAYDLEATIKDVMTHLQEKKGRDSAASP